MANWKGVIPRIVAFGARMPTLAFWRSLILRIAGIVGLVGVMVAGTWAILMAFGLERSRLHWLLLASFLCEYGMIICGSISGMLAIGDPSVVMPKPNGSVALYGMVIRGIIRRLSTTSIVLSIAAGLLYLAIKQQGLENVGVFLSTFRYLSAFAISNVILFVVAWIWGPPWDE